MNGSWTVAHDFAFHFGGAERVTAQLQQAVGTGNVKVLAGNAQTLARMGISDNYESLSPHWVEERNYRPLAVMHAITALTNSVVQGNLLASSYGFSQMLRSEGSKVVYCHSPLRQAWSGVQEYSKSMGPITGSAWRYGAAPVIRGLDRFSATSTDHFIATSRAVQTRIRDYYHRDSIIIPPPVEDFFYPAIESTSEERNYVWAGRIVEPYKKLGILVEAFRRSPRRNLLIAGDGRDRAMIEKTAPVNVKFIGEVGSDRLAGLFRGASAVIMPSEDDFGMVAAEAIATGTPVIALAAGGALDTVSHGVSGVLYDESSPAGILRGLEEFEWNSWDRAEVARCGEPYRAESFRQAIRDYLNAIA